MNKTMLTEPNVRVEYIPAHRYLAVRDDHINTYWAFWENHNCEETCGIVESLQHLADPILSCHTAGWYWIDGKRGYSYGLGVAADYCAKVPEGFELREYPGSYYLVFYHPPFDFLKDCETVVTEVEKLAWNYDPGTKGFQWNEADCQDYQRMWPETVGYEVLRPVVKK